MATIAATVSVPSSRGKGEEVAGDGISEEGVVKGATLFFCVVLLLPLFFLEK